jgi:murein DD-endopeptidase MepM/ murein hydrolase activator NlpD
LPPADITKKSGVRRRTPPRGFRKVPAFLTLVFLLLPALPAAAQDTSSFPRIERLDNRDPVFKQYQDDVALSRRRVFGAAGAAAAGQLRLYRYAPAGENLYQLSARCNVPYASLATLNRLRHPEGLGAGVLLPSVPGIFVPEEAESDLERLIALSRSESDGTAIVISGQKWLFFPGADFTPTERIYFLNEGFHFPLRSYRVTSSFGLRSSPFTGRLQNHRGLDLAAPAGTPVYAARDGTVSERGSDAVYGNYVIVNHGDSWASLYGHLSSISAAKGDRVGRNTVIGLVGSTGQSTGPHLHFEIRKNGTALDPDKLLFAGGR